MENILINHFKRFFLLKLLFLYFSYLSIDNCRAENINLKPDIKDKCPVCGMFVYKYPDFLALIITKNNEKLWFDGAKDLFKFLIEPHRYKINFDKNKILAIYVSDYYSLKLIDATKAFYVIGSDVYGPMGKELIAFENFSDAKEFMKDHRGKKILKFKEVNEKILSELN